MSSMALLTATFLYTMFLLRLMSSKINCG
jgi:hypothetical protein